jgi:hypothetical protein
LTSNNRYTSYLLRLQLAQNDDRPTWLASIQSTQTGELRWFSNVDALIQFFHEEFGNYDPKQNTPLPR